MERENLLKYFKEINGDTWLLEEDRNNLLIYYKIKDILSNRKSPYQHINIIDTYDFGKCLVLDGAIQTTEVDGFIYNEMITHVPMITHKNPRKVLIIGGGDCGAAKELTKYDELLEIDLVEIDEMVVEECINKLPEVSGNAHKDKRVNFIFQDGIQFIKGKKGVYDIVIVDSSDPIGPAEVLFTEEFYGLVRESLKEDGLMVCQSQSLIFQRDILKGIRKILKNYFPIVETYMATIPSYPGGMWSFTLASLKYNPLEGDLERLPSNTKYITKEIYKSSFNLPKFIEDDLKDFPG